MVSLCFVILFQLTENTFDWKLNKASVRTICLLKTTQPSNTVLLGKGAGKQIGLCSMSQNVAIKHFNYVT